MADNRMSMQESLAQTRTELIGHKFRHFKGNIYKVLFIGVHSETAEPYVVYVNEEHPDYTWIRPLDMFISEVDHVKYPNVTQKYRFEKID